jgi:Ca2+-binding RTX toxin-like protein
MTATMTGALGPDTLAGPLLGPSQSDVILGLGGDDLLVGASGTDAIHGGSGSDNLLGPSGLAVIHLQTIDANGPLRCNGSFKFQTGGKPPAPVAGSLWQEITSSASCLHGDIDGDGKDDFRIDHRRSKLAPSGVILRHETASRPASFSATRPRHDKRRYCQGG